MTSIEKIQKKYMRFDSIISTNSSNVPKEMM